MTPLTEERRSSVLMIAGLVVLLTFLAFLPALRGEFLNWDDGTLLTENPAYRGLSLENLRWMFSTTLLGNYQPLTWLSYAFDYSIWGMNPLGYRLTNVILHSVNALLVFVLAGQVLRLSSPNFGGRSRLIGAAFAALFFSLHPLRVESVAWVTERKDVLSGCLLLASVIAYFRYTRDPRGGREYWMSVGCYGLSLLAKVWGITLPVVLLILDIYPTGRLTGLSGRRRWREGLELLREKAPFVLFAAAAAWKAYQAQSASMDTWAPYRWTQRIAQSCYSVVFYVWKTVLPTGLSPLHERPLRLDPFAPRYVICMAIVAVASISLIVLRRRHPALLAAWLIYLVVLSPVVGLVPVGAQIVAERYTYLACVPIALLLAGGIARVMEADHARALHARVVRFAAGTAVLAVLFVSTWRYCAVWRDSWSLWNRVVAVEPASWLGNSFLGTMSLQEGKLDTARNCLEKAERSGPVDALLEYNLAMCLKRLGQTDQAIIHLRRGARIPGAKPNILLMIADGLRSLGRPTEAQAVCSEVLTANPSDATACAQLGFAVSDLGADDAAIVHLERAIALSSADPAGEQTYRKSCEKLAMIFQQRGDAERAARYRRMSMTESPR